MRPMSSLAIGKRFRQWQFSRQSYVLYMILLFSLFYNVLRFAVLSDGDLERVGAAFLFGNAFEAVLNEAAYSWRFWGLTVAVSLAALVMTAARLRNARVALWPALLILLPYVNLLAFVMIALLPPASVDAENRAAAHRRWQRYLPHSRTGSAALAVAVSALIGLVFFSLSIFQLEFYGYGVFVGTPFSCGFIAAMIYAARQHRRLGACLGVAAMAITLLSALLFVLAVEGIVCLIIVAPIAYFLALLGAIFAYFLQPAKSGTSFAAISIVALFIELPLLMGTEALQPTVPPLHEVRTQMAIDAPREVVWEQVVAFSELDPPRDWLFKMGIAYPIRARIEGSGVGAVRYCMFSTGDFVEPIEVWEAPSLLCFSVIESPPAMNEFSPYASVQPPHIENYLRSERGQFRLTEDGHGGTLLEGTTWYRHWIWPAVYWRPFSDYIISRIHRRVLRHIKRQSETAAGMDIN